MQEPFEEIELRPALARLFELLLDGRSCEQIAAATGLSDRTMRETLSHLAHELRRALPAETTTYHHLLAREFMRRQDAILRDAVLAARQPAPKVDPDPDARLDDYRFFFTDRVAVAKA